jgi:hypothetical protein
MPIHNHGGNLPTAIFFANYLMSISGFAAFHDRGVKIPNDIGVAVFGDQPQMEYVRPRLTRVGVPSVIQIKELARRSASGPYADTQHGKVRCQSPYNQPAYDGGPQGGRNHETSRSIAGQPTPPANDRHPARVSFRQISRERRSDPQMGSRGWRIGQTPPT